MPSEPLQPGLPANSYFRLYEHRFPSANRPMAPGRTRAWQFVAGITLGLGAWYLIWRWSETLNPHAPIFATLVLSAETMVFLGAALFFFDIWEEGDTPQQQPPATRAEAGLDPVEAPSEIGIDILITTMDEPEDILEATLADACAVSVPSGCTVRIFLLDDGRRDWVRALADRARVGYFTRNDNHGFKAGNLRHALLRTQGDFVVICDADTRLMPAFLIQTLGYFRNPDVAWVQTPHWFYDIPGARDDPLETRRKSGPSRFTHRILGADPFFSDPQIFFDVIQRRRNRHGASFCCGAGSIHRREAVFETALNVRLQDLTRQKRILGSNVDLTELQPFRFHVSEDLYSSILTHAEGHWRSVFHPVPLTRMLSPWSLRAWQTQRLKYAGGTFDILLRAAPLFRKQMPWAIRLHYAATFWSYLTNLWGLVLLLAPAWALIAGVSPVYADPLLFFLHLLPVLISNEIAMCLAGKGEDFHRGRLAALATLPLNLRALASVVRGRRPKFPPTPKSPLMGRGLHAVLGHVALLVVVLGAAGWGLFSPAFPVAEMGRGMLVVNLFWIGWSGLALLRIILTAFWRPPLDELLHVVSSHSAKVPA